MSKFSKGDVVTLGKDNGTKAFQVLSPGSHYTVEAVGNSCSACSNGRAGMSTTVKIHGAYFCEEAFVAATQAAPRGGVASKRDPARDLYGSGDGPDFFDLLPDPTHEEMKTLPTYEQLQEINRKKFEERIKNGKA